MLSHLVKIKEHWTLKTFGFYCNQLRVQSWNVSSTKLYICAPDSLPNRLDSWNPSKIRAYCSKFRAYETGTVDDRWWWWESLKFLKKLEENFTFQDANGMSDECYQFDRLSTKIAQLIAKTIGSDCSRDPVESARVRSSTPTSDMRGMLELYLHYRQYFRLDYWCHWAETYASSNTKCVSVLLQFNLHSTLSVRQCSFRTAR